MTTADDLVAEWAAITETPLTRSLRRKWYGSAVEFVSAMSTGFPATEFLRYAASEGCNSPGGWPHYVAAFTRKRTISGVSPETSRRAAETIARIRSGEDRDR